MIRQELNFTNKQVKFFKKLIQFNYLDISNIINSNILILKKIFLRIHKYSRYLIY
jgi:hypothetical protein